MKTAGKNKYFFILFLLVTTVLLMFFLSAGYAQETSREERRIIDATEVFQEMVARKDEAGALGMLLKSAHGVAIFPKVTKIGLGFGVQFGEGLVLRRDIQTGRWYGPAFVEIKTASVGPQIGIQNVALLLVIMDESGINAFKETDFELSANISISAGPTGESLQADADFNDSIYTYSYSEGLYAGFTLDGSVIHADRGSNRDFYGKSITTREILDGYEAANKSALRLIVEIQRITP